MATMIPTSTTGAIPGNAAAQTDALAELRNIHLPDPVSGFPVAPGWWILAVLVLVSSYLIIRWLIRYWLANRYRRAGTRQLNELLKQFERDEDQKKYLANFAILIKRLAMTVYPRERVASLTGEEWVAFLDKSAGSNAFSMGVGQVLMYSAYEKEAQFDVQQLHQSGLHWIRKHRRQL